MPWREHPPASSEIKAKTHQEVDEIFATLEAQAAPVLFDAMEKPVRLLVFSLGRLFLAYFLAWRHEPELFTPGFLSSSCGPGDLS